MVVKKQLRKISKKIIILGLATSIIFTSCFSTKKIEAHAASVAAGFTAYTLYEICLYIGGIAISTLGIGYAYDNRDEIAHFGKTLIDSISSVPEQGWYFGATAPNQDPTIYGREALVAIQMAEWASIVLGGQMPDPNKNNNDDDGDEGEENPEGDSSNEGESSEPLSDYDKRSKELGFINFFLTSSGVQLIGNVIKSSYNTWVNREDDNFLNDKYGHAISYSGDQINTDGLYYGNLFIDGHHIYLESSSRLCVLVNYTEEWGYEITIGHTKPGFDLYFDGEFLKTCTASKNNFYKQNIGSGYLPDLLASEHNFGLYQTDLPVFFNDYLNNNNSSSNYILSGVSNGINNQAKSYYIADWIADDDVWKGYLEDISTTLRSLEDLVNISLQLSNEALINKPSSEDYANSFDTLSEYYEPLTDPIVNPNYYPATNTTPQLDPSEFPNYQPSKNPDSGEIPDEPTQGGSGNGDDEIDLDGLGSIFSILFYLIMIIIMLIYLFLACLSFIVMIFRIPPSSSMLPEEMVMGFDHLKTIMIPGFNISIYGFAMALIYLLIIFTVIKILRLEINDFKFPRPGKKP